MPEQEHQELEELKTRLADLTRRVYRLESVSGLTSPAKPAETAPPSQPAASSVAAPPKPVAPLPPPPLFLSVSSRKTASGGLRRPVDSDLEGKIGSQWLNRIGVFALLIGAAYFLKLAFDNGWIGPSGRVAIGLLAGIVLVAFASRLHGKGLPYFAYSLAAAGIGIMYLSLWAAFQLYHLMPAGAAFAAMIAVTASAAWLALRLNAQIIAVVALAGGFATPALLSTGQNRPIELFTYFLLLNAATVVLVSFRPWRRLLAGSFVATTIYYFVWHASFFTEPQTFIAVFYAAAFFVMWSVLPILRPVHVVDGKVTPWASSNTFVVVALVNPIVFFFELWMTYENQAATRTTLAWYAIALGAFYIVLARSAQSGESKPGEVAAPFIRWLHLGIALSFLTLAIPLKLDAHWITIAWIVEAGIFVVIGARLDHAFLKGAAVIALALGLLRLLAIDDFHPERLIFNMRMATFALALIVLGMMIHGARQQKSTHHLYVAFSIAFNVVALIAILGEATLYYQRVFATLHTGGGYGYGGWRDIVIQRDFVYSGLAMLYGFGLLAVGFWRRSSVLRWQALVLIFCTIAKVFLYDLSNLTGVLRVLSFIALGVLLMGASFVYQRDWLKLSEKEQL